MFGHKNHFILVEQQSEMVLILINGGGSIRMSEEENYLRVRVHSLFMPQVGTEEKYLFWVSFSITQPCSI